MRTAVGGLMLATNAANASAAGGSGIGSAHPPLVLSLSPASGVVGDGSGDEHLELEPLPLGERAGDACCAESLTGDGNPPKPPLL